MKTTKIKWRLGNLPTPEELRGLVKDSLVSKEEAREILFTLETDDTREKKSLEAEIKFLRQLIEKLSSPSIIIQTIKEVQKPYYQQPWYAPYATWTNAIGTSGSLTVNGSSGITSFTNTANTAAITGTGQSFSDIQTF